MAFIRPQQSMACSCISAHFGERDIIRGVENFMVSKMKVDQADIIEIDSFNERYFARGVDKVVVKLISMLESEAGASCEMGCMTGMNRKTDHLIEFYRGDRRCKVKLESKYTSNYTNSGFKSVIKKSKRAVCE